MREMPVHAAFRHQPHLWAWAASSFFSVAIKIEQRAGCFANAPLFDSKSNRPDSSRTPTGARIGLATTSEFPHLPTVANRTSGQGGQRGPVSGFCMIRSKCGVLAAARWRSFGSSTGPPIRMHNTTAFWGVHLRRSGDFQCFPSFSGSVDGW